MLQVSFRLTCICAIWLQACLQAAKFRFAPRAEEDQMREMYVMLVVSRMSMWWCQTPHIKVVPVKSIWNMILAKPLMTCVILIHQVLRLMKRWQARMLKMRHRCILLKYLMQGKESAKSECKRDCGSNKIGDSWDDGHDASENTSEGETRDIQPFHSSLQNIIEKSFGVPRMKWRVLLSIPWYKLETQKMVVNPCMCLHNCNFDIKLHEHGTWSRGTRDVR